MPQEGSEDLQLQGRQKVLGQPCDWVDKVENRV